MVLQHLYSHKVRQEALILIRAHLLEVELFPSNLLKLRYDACDRVVIGRCENSFAAVRFRLFQSGLDEFSYILSVWTLKKSHSRLTHILSCIEEGKLCLLTNWICESIGSVVALLQHLLVVGHVVTRQNESRWDTSGTYVLFDLCLAIEVDYVRQSAVGHFRDIEERREDDVLDSNFSSNISHVFALGLFDLRISGFLVVGYEEDRMGTLDRGGD